MDEQSLKSSRLDGIPTVPDTYTEIDQIDAVPTRLTRLAKDAPNAATVFRSNAQAELLFGFGIDYSFVRSRTGWAKEVTTQSLKSKLNAIPIEPDKQDTDTENKNPPRQPD